MSEVRRAVGLATLSLLLGGFAAERVSERERRIDSKLKPMQPVLFTVSPVKAGDELGASRLAVRMVPRRWAPAGTLDPATPMTGLVASVGLPPGAVLGPGTWRERGLGSVAGLGSGQRAVSVVALAPIGALIPGVHADLLATRGDRRPVLLLRGAEVLAVRRADEADSGSGHRVEADLRSDLRGALAVSAAIGAGAELRLLPIGGG